MSSSNYPGGFMNGVTIRGVPIQQLYPGEVFWVNSTTVLSKGGIGGSDGNTGTYRKPLSTIDKALALATASRGDVVVCMPGHSETITTDGGLALDKAGVAIIGLGMGTLRPKIVVDTAAAAAITVTAANVTMQNFVIEASFADITNAFDVTAVNFSLLDSEFTEEGANLNFLDYILCSGAANSADGLRVEGCVGTSIDAGQNSFINTVEDIDRLVYRNNSYLVDHANCLQSILVTTAKKLTQCIITDNVHISLTTTSPILVSADQTTNTGIIARNLVGHADVGAVEIADCDGVRHFENYTTSTDGGSGAIEPAADSIT